MANLTAEETITTASYGLLIAGTLTALFTGIAATIGVYNFRKRLRLSFVEYIKVESVSLCTTEYLAVIEKRGVGIASGCQSIVEFEDKRDRRELSPIEKQAGIPNALDSRGQIMGRTEVSLFRMSGISGDQKGVHRLIIADSSVDRDSFEELQQLGHRHFSWAVVSENAVGISKTVSIGEVVRKAKQVSRPSP